MPIGHHAKTLAARTRRSPGGLRFVVGLWVVCCLTLTLTPISRAEELRFAPGWGEPHAAPSMLSVSTPDVASGAPSGPNPPQHSWPPIGDDPSGKISDAVADSLPLEPQRTTLGPRQSFVMGYDGGFVIASDALARNDSDGADFLMRVNSWSQLRHVLFDSQGPNPDQNSFSFERLRLAFRGHVFSRDLQYFFQLDGNSDSSSNVIFLDYFASYDVGRGVLGCEEGQLGVRFGKWKVPFSRSRRETGRQLQFTDRSMANVFFDLNRSLGVGLFGRIDHFQAPIHWETALFNGFRTGSASTSRIDAELDDNFGWSLRTFSDLLGDVGEDGEADLSWHAAPAFRLGGGLATTRVDEQGQNEFDRQTVVDSGLRLASILPTGATAYDVFFATVDAHFKYHGWSAIAEYYWRRMANFSGTDVPVLSDGGLNLQAGYFVVPEKFEVHGRWARIAGDSGTLGGPRRSADAIAAGAAWYLRGHNAKLLFDVTHHNGVPIGENRIDTLAGDVGWFFRTQFQLAF